jgi:predicted transcriptional regulator
VLEEKSNNINSKWRERKESTQKSIEKYKSISESVDSQYYTYIEGRKTPPRNKELFKAMVKVDTSYY